MRFLFRPLTIILLVAVGMTLSPPVQAAPAAQPAPSFAYFPETGHNIGLEIKAFFDANGGLAIFGLPLTELIKSSDGQTVQYFERARVEYRSDQPQGARVALSRAGSMLTAGRTDEPFQWRVGSDDPARDFYPESGHTLGGAFRWFWQSNGGVAVFGFPISEEFYEANPLDGQTYLVQYFERARFEYHPELAGSAGEVQLAHLGRQLLAQDPAAQAATAPVAEISLLGEATTGFSSSSNERVTNIGRATEMINGWIVPVNTEFSFVNVGDFSEANGFVDGYGIVGGRLERVIGGGLCQVSTTLFRAVSNAGLKITRRVGHSHIVNFYENILGFDATVFTPSVDFRWFNDSPGTTYIVAWSDKNAGRVTFQIWGVSDGRKVSYEGPVTKNWTNPGKPVWQYDPNLPNGAVRQLVHGRRGVDVAYTRIIRDAKGRVSRTVYNTKYTPWEDFFIYGPGVNPPAGVTVIEPRSSR